MTRFVRILYRPPSATNRMPRRSESFRRLDETGLALALLHFLKERLQHRVGANERQRQLHLDDAVRRAAGGAEPGLVGVVAAWSGPAGGRGDEGSFELPKCLRARTAASAMVSDAAAAVAKASKGDCGDASAAVRGVVRGMRDAQPVTLTVTVTVSRTARQSG